MGTRLFSTLLDIRMSGRCSKFGSYDFHHAGLNAGPSWHLVPLTRFDVDFQKLVNLDTLIPLLNQDGILSPVELRELHVVHRSESWRISYLLSVLDRKGKQGIKALIFALKSDEEHAYGAPRTRCSLGGRIL